MAKNKSFNFDSLKTEAAALGVTNSIPEKKTETKINDAPTPRTSAVAMPAAAPQDVAETTSVPKATDQLSMKPKKKKDKRVNYIVNEDDNIEFTNINKRLGYSNNEVIVKLMDMYIKANRE